MFAAQTLEVEPASDIPTVLIEAMAAMIEHGVASVLELDDQFPNSATSQSMLDKALDVVPWRVLEDGSDVLAPRLSGTPLLFNFTEDCDDWVQARDGFDYFKAMKHHEKLETEAIKVLFNLAGGVLDLMNLLDTKIMKMTMTREDVSSARAGFNWMPLVNHAGDLSVSIVIAGSDAPTLLFFIKDDGSVVRGTGEEFLKQHLGDSKIEDFKCKVKAELQFVNVMTEKHQKRLAVKAHSVVFAKAPKESVAGYSDDELAIIVRASKRIRVSRF